MLANIHDHFFFPLGRIAGPQIRTRNRVGVGQVILVVHVLCKPVVALQALRPIGFIHACNRRDRRKRANGLHQPFTMLRMLRGRQDI